MDYGFLCKFITGKKLWMGDLLLAIYRETTELFTKMGLWQIKKKSFVSSKDV